LHSFSVFLGVNFCQNENNQNFKRECSVENSHFSDKNPLISDFLLVTFGPMCVCVCVCVAKFCHLVTRTKKKGVDVGFFWKNLHKFLRERFFFLFNQVPKGSYQVFNVFPKMFPIAPHFYVVCFGQDWTFVYINDNGGGECSMFQIVFWWWVNQCDSLPKRQNVRKKERQKRKNFDHTHQLIDKKHEYTYIHEFSSLKAKPIKWHWWKQWVHCRLSSYAKRDKAHMRKLRKFGTSSRSTTFYSAYSIK
jgi:hypothetical protein